MFYQFDILIDEHVSGHIVWSTFKDKRKERTFVDLVPFEPSVIHYYVVKLKNVPTPL